MTLTPDLSIPQMPQAWPRRSRMRGWLRLLRLIGATSYASARFVAASTLRGKNPDRVMRHGQRWTGGLIRKLGLDVQTFGALPEGGCLVVANHRSYIDIAPLYTALPGFFLAKAEVAAWPVLGWAARLGDTVFVSRSDPDSRRRSRVELAERLRRGHRVLVFPEGTTHAGPGILPFRPALFELAARENLPVVPVAIEYAAAADAWVGDDTFVRHFLERFAEPRMSVRLAIGPPLRHIDADMLRARAEEWIRSELKAPISNIQYSETDENRKEAVHAQP